MMIECKKCHTSLPHTEFVTRADTRSGLSGSCRVCTNLQAKAAREKRLVAPEYRAKINAAHREWYKKTGYKYVRDSELRYRYGISQREFDEISRSQLGVCASCGLKPSAQGLVTDHDHKTGVVRGLLCTKCNAGIGFFNDDPERLCLAIKYLSKQEPALAPLDA